MGQTIDVIDYVETQYRTLCTGHPFILDGGKSLSPVTIAFETYGSLNADRSNAILLCHALTGSSHAAGWNSPDDKDPGWWDPLIGPGRAFDTDKYFVVCSNILGSCYGTTGPGSIDPCTGQSYRASFPAITVRDMVRLQKLLLDTLGVRELVTVCGSSLGGMQALEWAVMYPEVCRSIIPISVAAKQSSWCIALNAIARAAITSDPVWNGGCYAEQPANGLGIARMVGMISYRTAEELERRFGRRKQDACVGADDTENLFQVESYLRHQGRKLAERFDANAYLCLSHATDAFDLGDGRGAIADVLGRIEADVLSIGVSSDLRYPVQQQKDLARQMPYARYAQIESIHGHDAFLIEYDQLAAIIIAFLRNGGRK